MAGVDGTLGSALDIGGRSRAASALVQGAGSAQPPFPLALHATWRYHANVEARVYCGPHQMGPHEASLTNPTSPYLFVPVRNRPTPDNYIDRTNTIRGVLTVETVTRNNAGGVDIPYCTGNYTRMMGGYGRIVQSYPTAPKAERKLRLTVLVQVHLSTCNRHPHRG